jgi:hypothetical protein
MVDSKEHWKRLPAIDCVSPEAEHPEWVRKEYGDHVAHAHVDGPVTSTRTLAARGNTIVIKTTYEISIEGKPWPLHMMVDSDGRLWSHLCPYSTFATAPELVSYLLEHAPEALLGLPAGECMHGDHHAKPDHKHDHTHGHGGES